MAINDISLTSGMRSNLLSLQGTVDLLNRTQNRLSTGKKVNSAMDNPVSFFASQALTSRASVIDSLKDAMGQAVQTITAADKGITAITSMIEQAKGIAQAALSAEQSSGYNTETVTLNTVALGDTIQIGATTLTAGPSGTGTTTTLDSQTITFADAGDVGDTINVGGLTFTAAAASATSVGTFTLDLSVNTMDAGAQVTVGGVVYTAVASTSSTTYNSFELTLNNVQANDTFTVGGATYTAIASAATTAYNHFTVDFTTIAAGDQITVGAHTYTATAAAAAGANEFSLDAGIPAAINELKALIATDSPADFGTSGITANAFDITAADGNILGLADVSSTRAGAVAADTTVTTNTPTASQFKVGATDSATATNLMAAITARQPNLYDFTGSAANAITIAADGGAPALTATSVAIGVSASGWTTLTDSETAVDTTVVSANQFVISGDAGMDATNLRAKINALQSANYTAGGAGSTITIVGAGSTVMGDTSVVGPGHGVTVSTTVATSANTLGQFEFGVGANANASAANLSAKLSAVFGAQLGVANASSSSVITITSGTTDLTATTVTAGTDADNTMVIAAHNTVTTGDTYDATHFAVTGDNTVDAAALMAKINGNAAITAAHYSATASAGVLTIANSMADVAAGNVLVSDATTMVEATVTASSELSSLQDQYNEMMVQIDALAADSGYKGKNLLQGGILTVKFEGANLNVEGFSANAADLIGANAAWTAAATAETAINASITALDAATTTLQSQSSKLSGNLSIITVRQSFSTNMINTLTAGADKLVAADTNEEGANMLMLQTRQSLSTTALSLSAQAAQSVLKLFG